MRKHVITNHENLQYMCSYCTKSFSTESWSYANTHMKRCKMTIHSTCSQCDKVCHNEAHLEQRKKTHSEGVTCDVCNKASSTQYLGWNKLVNICTRSLIQLKDLTKVLEISEREKIQKRRIFTGLIYFTLTSIFRYKNLRQETEIDNFVIGLWNR